MNLVYLLLAFVAGMAISTQSAINGRLAANIGGDIVSAALISFLVGTAFLIVIVLARGGVGTTIMALPSQAPWRFLGGFLGAGFIFCTTLLAPKIGITNMLVLIIAGQLVASVTIDQFGLLEMMRREVSVVKLLGVLTVMGGVGLTLFGDRVMEVVRQGN